MPFNIRLCHWSLPWCISSKTVLLWIWQSRSCGLFCQ